MMSKLEGTLEPFAKFFEREKRDPARINDADPLAELFISDFCMTTALRCL
jgi:hypothetical protein